MKQFFRSPRSWAHMLYVMETMDRDQTSVAAELGISRQAVAQFRKEITRHINVTEN